MTVIKFKYKNAEQQIQVDSCDLVYQRIREYCENNSDILVLRSNFVCYFNETFDQFIRRTNINQEIILYAISLQNLFDDFEVIKNDYERLKIYNKDKNERQKILQQQQEKFKVQSNYSSLIQTQVESTYEQEFQNTVIEKLYNEVSKQKALPINQQSNLVLSIIEPIGVNESLIKTIKPICYFCNNFVAGKSINLSCFHLFHEDCLKVVFQSQLSLQNTHYSCLCKQKVDIKVLNHFQDSIFKQLCFQKLLQIQINFIINKYQLKKCNRQTCYFYFIDNNTFRKEKAYCPLCLDYLQM